MPLVWQRKVAEGSTLALWKITESPSALTSLCNGQRHAEALALSGERLRERLAWCALLEEVSPGARIFYDEYKGPLLEDGRKLGVSHTKGYAAIMISDVPCAVDIEIATRDFSRALPRFATPEEQRFGEILAPQGLYPALIWCAKEVLYKWNRRPGPALLREIRIDAIDPPTHTLEGSIQGRSLKMGYLHEEGLCCAWGPV